MAESRPPSRIASPVADDAEAELLSTFDVPAAFLDPAADVLLKSSDGALFKVHKTILCLGSGFFANMFGDASPAAENASSYDPVIWSEPASTVTLLLQYLYPSISLPEISTMDVIITLTVAADKWEIDRVVTAMRAEMKKPSILEDRPMAVYNLACRFEFEDLKRLAARQLVEAHDPHDAKFRDDLPGLSAVDFVALYNLRKGLVEYAQRITREFLKQSCPCHPTSNYSLVYGAWRQAMESELASRPSSRSIPSHSYLISNLELRFNCGSGSHRGLWLEETFRKIKEALDNYPEQVVPPTVLTRAYSPDY